MCLANIEHAKHLSPCAWKTQQIMPILQAKYLKLQFYGQTS